MNVGVIGLGLMGSPIACRLVDSGHRVVVTSRRRASGADAVAAGAEWADSVAEVALRSEVLITSLPRAGDVQGALADDLSDVATVIDTSTIGPASATAIAGALSQRGVDFVDAPVSGGPPSAANGTLAIMVGAAPFVYARVESLLLDLGKPRLMGPVGTGQSTKLVNQVLIAGIVAGVADAFRLASALEVEPDGVLEAVRDGFGYSALLDWAWPRIANGDLAPGFKVSHFVKDLDLALAADTHGTPLAFVTAVRDAYLSLGPDSRDLGTQALVGYDAAADADHLSKE